MDNNITPNTSNDVEKKTKKTIYDEVLEKRTKLVVPENQLEISEEINSPVPEKKKNEPEIKPCSFEEALAKAAVYFKNDSLAANVWINKYALKDSEGKLYELTPDDMHRRIAKEIARIEKKYPNPLNEEDVFALLKNFRYIIPQGSPMAGIGNNFQIGSLSNCFVIGSHGNSDSYGGIMKVDEEQVQLMKRRGGVGHDLSHIRPSGSPVLFLSWRDIQTLHAK